MESNPHYEPGSYIAQLKASAIIKATKRLKRMMNFNSYYNRRSGNMNNKMENGLVDVGWRLRIKRRNGTLRLAGSMGGVENIRKP